MSTAPDATKFKDVPSMLLSAGFTPLGAAAEYWVAPGGGTPLTTDAAAGLLVEFFNTARKALLSKHFLQTSEFWLAASGPIMGAPVAIAGLAGMADFLGPPWSGVVTGFCAFAAVATPAAYKIARMLAKHYAAREGIKELPEEAGK